MSRRNRKRIFKLVISLVLIGASYYISKNLATTANVAQTIPAGNYAVTEVVDGDTIEVNMNGKREKIRMIGVDTPETKDPRKTVECFGKAASDYTKQLIGTGSVRLEADPLGTNRDRYNRLLRYVYNSENKLVQAELIKDGYAFAYVSFPFSKLEEFRQYEKNAREQNLGLWGGCQPYLDNKGYIHSSPAT